MDTSKRIGPDRWTCSRAMNMMLTKEVRIPSDICRRCSDCGEEANAATIPDAPESADGSPVREMRKVTVSTVKMSQRR